VLQVEGFEKRVVYNVAKAYVAQIARGELYPDLNDVVGITICDFEIWPENGERKVPMLSRWQMTEQQSGARDLGQIRLVFLELPKYDTSQSPRTMVEKWAYFFREAESGTPTSSRGSRSRTSGAHWLLPRNEGKLEAKLGEQRRACDWGSKPCAGCWALSSRRNGRINWPVSMRRSLRGCWPSFRTRRYGREPTDRARLTVIRYPLR